MSILGDCFMLCGSLFQSKGAEYLNASAAKVSRLTLGISKVVPLLFHLMLLHFGLLIVIKSLLWCLLSNALVDYGENFIFNSLLYW